MENGHELNLNFMPFVYLSQLSKERPWMRRTWWNITRKSDVVVVVCVVLHLSPHPTLLSRWEDEENEGRKTVVALFPLKTTQCIKSHSICKELMKGIFSLIRIPINLAVNFSLSWRFSFLTVGQLWTKRAAKRTCERPWGRHLYKVGGMEWGKILFCAKNTDWPLSPPPKTPQTTEELTHERRRRRERLSLVKRRRANRHSQGEKREKRTWDLYPPRCTQREEEEGLIEKRLRSLEWKANEALMQVW